MPLKYPLGSIPEAWVVLSSGEKLEAGRVFPEPRLGKDGCLKPPTLVRHRPPNPQSELLGGGAGSPGPFAPVLLTPHPGHWPVLSCPGNQGASWEPRLPPCSQQHGAGIRGNESYSGFKSCSQPRAGVSALVLPLPQ